MIPEAAREPLSNTLTVAAVGQTLILTGSALARVVSHLPAHQLDTTSFATFYGALAVGACASWWGARRLKDAPKRVKSAPPAAAAPAHAVEPYAAAAECLPEIALPSHPFIRRLQQVIERRDVLIAEPLVQDDAGEYIQFAIRATKPGMFAGERTRRELYTLLTNSVGGHWDLRADPHADTLTFTRKAGFPAVVTPPVPARIPQSADEARRHYPDFRMRLGVTATGEALEIDMAKYPHSLFIGGTGSGKSVFARALIESFRVAGWMIFLGDGKGTDYEGLHRQPGIVAISQRTADHVRMVRMVAEELKGRQADAQRRKRAGEQDPFQRPPLLLLLDEYATMLAEIKAEYGADTFESDLLFLTRVGREFKVHVGFASQEAYRDTLPGTLLGNIGLRVSLGPPADKTIKEVFPEKLRSDAIRIGGTISKNDRGRGLALMTDDEGTARAVEFQSYYGYSPAESKPAPNTEIASEWDRYKTQASDRVPTLYPRMWFAVDGPDYAADLDTLYGLEAVRLTSRDGTARPGTAIHDPLSDDYLGGVSAAGSVLEYLDELEEDQPDHLHTTRATPYPFDDAEADPVLDDEPPHLDLALTEDSPAAATAVAEPEPELATPVVVEPIPEPVPAPNRIPRRQQGV